MTLIEKYETSARQQIKAVESFALQMHYPADWPTPILPDELLDALGDFFEQERLWERGLRFVCFCHSPQVFGFHRPVEHGIGKNERRLLTRQRYVAARNRT